MGQDISDKKILPATHLPASLTSTELKWTFENPLLKDLCDRQAAASSNALYNVHCVLHTENLL